MKRVPQSNGPGFLFILAALVVVAVVGARLLGFAPGASKAPVQPTPPAGVGGTTHTPKAALPGPQSSGRAPEPTVLIYHTYATENYAPKAPNAKGGAGDIVDVGTALVAALDTRGIRAVHDTGIGDYPHFSEAVGNARARIKSVMAEYPQIRVLIDLHRDALPTGEEQKTSPSSQDKARRVMETTVDSQTVARILLVVGNVDNPHAAANVEFAKKLKDALDAKHPGVARAVVVQPKNLNDDLSDQALQVYIGGYAATAVPDAKRAAQYFADALAGVLQQG